MRVQRGLPPALSRAVMKGLAALPFGGAHFYGHFCRACARLLLVNPFIPGKSIFLDSRDYLCQLEKTFAKFTKGFIFLLCRIITTLSGDIIGGGVVYDQPLACVVFYQVFIKF